MTLTIDLVIISIFSVIPLAFALVVLAPTYLNWQNKRILNDILKLCDNRLEQEMINMWLADNYTVIPYDRQAYSEASRKIVAELIKSGYQEPHNQLKRTVEEFTWLTNTGKEPSIEEIQTVLNRIDSVLNTLDELLRYSLVEEQGVYMALKERFEKNLGDSRLKVKIQCQQPGMRYAPAFEKQLAEGCMLLLIEMTYNRTGTSITMDLQQKANEVIVDLYDDDDTYTNVDLLLQPPTSWPFNFLFVRLVVRKYLMGKFSGPLNYHQGLHLQAKIPVPREEVLVAS